MKTQKARGNGLKKTLMVSHTDDEGKSARELSWILVIIGFILTLLGSVGLVTFKTDDKFGLIAVGGLAFMVFGTFLWRFNRRYEPR
jgi:hypothetical protein